MCFDLVFDRFGGCLENNSAMPQLRPQRLFKNECDVVVDFGVEEASVLGDSLRQQLRVDERHQQLFMAHITDALRTRSAKSATAPLPPKGLTVIAAVAEDKAYSIVCVVLQINSMQKVVTRNGRESVWISVLVGDQSKSFFKVVFWGKAVDWIGSIQIGHVVLFNKLRISCTNGIVVANTSPESSFEVIFQATDDLKKISVSKEYHQYALQLAFWAQQKFSVLFSLALIVDKQKHVEFENVENIDGITVSKSQSVHIRGLLEKLDDSSTSVKYPLRMILSSEEGKIPLYVWQDNRSLASNLQRCIGQFVELTFLSTAIPTSYNHDTFAPFSLHTSSNTQMKVISSHLEDCKMWKDISAPKSPLHHSLTNHDGSRFYQIRSQVSKVILARNPNITSNRNISKEAMLSNFLEKIVYIGCGRCAGKLSKVNCVSICNSCPLPTHTDLTENPYIISDYYFFPMKFILSNDSNPKSLPINVPGSLVKLIFGVSAQDVYNSLQSSELFMKDPCSFSFPPALIHFIRLICLLQSSSNSPFLFGIETYSTKHSLEEIHELKTFKWT